jgi:hypothetical protein
MKTLKDLERDYINFKYIERRELKQEAINWIKEFQTERTIAISEMFDNPDESGIYPTTKFFNRIDKFWLDKFNSH